MKNLKSILIFFFSLAFIYLLIGIFLKSSNNREIGKINFNNKKSYIKFIHIDEFRDFDDLYFELYKNDSLIIKKRYFDSTDGEPEISDIKLRNYLGLYYITCFDSTRVKIICDNNLNVVFPIDYGGLKDDSISKLPSIKKLLMNKNLTLGRW